VLVSARRFKDLGAWDGVKEIDAVKSVEMIPRQLQAAEMISNPNVEQTRMLEKLAGEKGREATAQVQASPWSGL
jgi:hypothetical protein